MWGLFSYMQMKIKIYHTTCHIHRMHIGLSFLQYNQLYIYAIWLYYLLHNY